MRRYIYGERDGIYIIDLLQTEALLDRRRSSLGSIAARGGIVLFVGTKKQARDAVKDARRARRHAVRQPPLARRPADQLQTINQRIKRLHDLERYEAEGQLELLPTRERLPPEADLAKLQAQPRRRQAHAAPPDASSSSTSRAEAIARPARPSACASRSSAWSTRTATPTASTS